LPTLELERKIRKQSWQVVANKPSHYHSKHYFILRAFFQLPDDNIPDKVWSVRATATAYLIAVYGSEIHSSIEYQYNDNNIIMCP
jgi:hypothetical protein